MAEYVRETEPSGACSQAVASSAGPCSSVDSRISARELRDSLPNLGGSRERSVSRQAETRICALCLLIRYDGVQVAVHLSWKCEETSRQAIRTGRAAWNKHLGNAQRAAVTHGHISRVLYASPSLSTCQHTSAPGCCLATSASAVSNDALATAAAMHFKYVKQKPLPAVYL